MPAAFAIDRMAAGAGAKPGSLETANRRRAWC